MPGLQLFTAELLRKNEQRGWGWGGGGGVKLPPPPRLLTKYREYKHIIQVLLGAVCAYSEPYLE